MLIAWNFFDSLAEGLTGLLLMLDGIVYWIISLLFGMFEELAKFEFLTQDTYQEIVNRFLVVLGVVMLFYLAYALLKALVNPDELKNSSKIVTNLVISLILLNIVPVIFNYSYELQNIIIDENVVGKIVLGNGTDNIASVGKRTAMQFLEAFLRPGKNAKIDGYDNWEHLKACILDNQLKKEDGITDLCQGNEGFRHITLTSQSIVSGDTEYIFIISTICGAFLVYVIASFCLDLGIRVVKLAFYQIISPIPIMMRIIPEKKSVFDNWVKATLATYLEVFIRLFVMYLISFLFTIIPDIMSSFNEGDLNIFGTIVVLMGLFAFAKQAPKLIGDVMGLDAGNLKLGIKDKLNANNYLGENIASGAIGAATGFLGGGWAAKVNGGNFMKGALAGGANGAKGKGNQFGKQRQAIYSLGGGKGKAGLFGGRSYFDARANEVQENAKKNMKDAYKSTHKKNIAKFERSNQFQEYMQNYNNTQINTAQGMVNEAQRSYDENKNIREKFENSAEYNGIMTRYYNQAKSEADVQMRQRMHEYSTTPEGRAKFQKDREDLISALQRKYTYQELKANNEKGLSSNAGKEYIEAMQNVNQLDNQLKSAQQNLDAVRSDNISAYEETKKYFMEGAGNKTKDGKAYEASVDYLNKLDEEKRIKDFLKTEEGQRAVATQKEAMKALEDENKKKGNSSKTSDDKK